MGLFDFRKKKTESISGKSFNMKGHSTSVTKLKDVGANPTLTQGRSILISSAPDFDDRNTILRYIKSNPTLLKEDVRELRILDNLDIDMVGVTNNEDYVILVFKEDARRSNVVVGRRTLDRYAHILSDIGKPLRIMKVVKILVRKTNKGLYKNVWVI